MGQRPHQGLLCRIHPEAGIFSQDAAGVFNFSKQIHLHTKISARKEVLIWCLDEQPSDHERRNLEPSDCLIITSVFHVSVPLGCTGFYCESVWGRQPSRVNQPNEKPCSSEEMITSGRKALDWLRDCVGTGRNQRHLAFHSVGPASAQKRVCVFYHLSCIKHMLLT